MYMDKLKGKSFMDSKKKKKKKKQPAIFTGLK